MGRPSARQPSARPVRGRAPASLLVRLVALVALLAPLAACAVIDPLKREICLAVVPALEPSGAAVEVVTVDAVAEPRDGVRVRYRVWDADHAASRLGEIACGFGDPEGTGDRRHLVSVTTRHGLLPFGRLVMLNRFWLQDQTLRRDALAGLAFAPSAEEKGLVALDRDAARLVQTLIDASAPAALYALTGLACALIYGLIGRINLAFGDIATFGAFGAIFGAVAVAASGGVAVGPVVLAALLVAMAVSGSWGAVLARTVFRPLAFRPAQPLLIATVGLSVALQEFVARSQGVRDLFLDPLPLSPLKLVDGPLTVIVPPLRLAVVALAALMVAVVLLGLPRIRFGRDWRAVADDPGMAALLGIEPGRVLASTFVLACTLAGVAGAVSTLAWGATSFHMGTVVGLKAVAAAVVGGMGSLPGAALGGLLLGLLETVWTAAFGGEWRDVAVFSALAATLVLRPQGLLGTPSALEERGRL